MRERMKGASLMLALLFAWVSQTHAFEICPSDQAQRIHIGAQTFNVKVAASPKESERGLSGRSALAADSGMWFVLPTPDWHGFWMQGMNFPIDLVWVSPARQVLGVITLQPCAGEYCRIHTPPSPVAYVLEINADAFAGKTGDNVTWSCTP
jgi:uncharacterized membrane protein (UPF0127 family)